MTIIDTPGPLNVPRTADRLCANAIRVLAMDGVQQANSGHPGMPMGMADAAYVLWSRFLKHNPSDPTWSNRDRFVLSAGHGSMLLYALLHLTGYDLSLDELRNFRQLGSRTPGHPEYGHTPGVETTTGPLGQGIATAVGMALAERYLAEQFNRPDFKLVDHYTYVIAGDGDLMEGLSHEAAGIAGHLKLGKLIVLYDDNHISIDGSTDLSFTENTLQRFLAYGWRIQAVDGHNQAEVAEAIEQARREGGSPTLIACRTTIGYGSPNKAGTSKVHGEPLGADEVRLSRQALGWADETPFAVPDEVYTIMRRSVQVGQEDQRAWDDLLARYREAHPDLAERWDATLERRVPANLAELLPSFAADPKGMATRAASGHALNAAAPHVLSLLGGSADLHGSNNTLIKGAAPIQPDAWGGRNLYFGVRENGMGSVLNGMALHGGFIPYGGTFLVFSDYMRPAIRLAALMGQQVIYVFTHDSIGLGEDGPTHQPIEHVATLRAMPNLYVVRPADANETSAAWQLALTRRDGPTALILTRQAVPTLDPAVRAGAARGGYVLRDADSPQAVVIASGSEVTIALEAAELLAQRGVAARVVSIPCWELFAQQDQAYRDSVLPPALKARVAVEAATSFGWERFVGAEGRVIGIDSFGASGPYKELYHHFGLTAERVADAVGELVAP
ncbi:MAG: transketolase [Chloroflexales bacterium]|nr:transketolase [Chloroflexales bacterium]